MQDALPENELTRANFFDFIVRVALQKYCKT